MYGVLSQVSMLLSIKHNCVTQISLNDCVVCVCNSDFIERLVWWVCNSDFIERLCGVCV